MLKAMYFIFIFGIISFSYPQEDLVYFPVSIAQNNPQYKEIELSWVGDFNPKMRALHESVGGKFSKRHVTYRKYFNEINAAERSVIIPVDTREKILNQD